MSSLTKDAHGGGPDAPGPLVSLILAAPPLPFRIFRVELLIKFSINATKLCRSLRTNCAEATKTLTSVRVLRQRVQLSERSKEGKLPKERRVFTVMLIAVQSTRKRPLLGLVFIGLTEVAVTEYFTKLQRKIHTTPKPYSTRTRLRETRDLGRSLALYRSAEMPLIGIYNNAGAVAVQASREEKKETERIRLLEQGTSFLDRAAKSAPDDQMVHFNYAYSLFLAGKYAEVVEQLRPVITADPRDGQAYFLYAKALEKIGKTEAATAADDQARRYLQTYAKWQTEWQKSQTTSNVSLLMRDVLSRDDVSDLMRKKAVAANVDAGSATQDLLVKARDLYQAGRDDEALPELHRVVMIEPTNAEAYLLSGRINQRRGDQEAAIAALKTAIFWDPKLIDAHILLGRIFLERGDRGEATKYASSAMTIDANNQEAIALQRQVTMGKN